MIEKPDLDDQRELEELRRSSSFKLFKRIVVEPLAQQLMIDLEALKPKNAEEGPVLAGQLRIIRKIFDDFNEAIGG